MSTPQESSQQGARLLEALASDTPSEAALGTLWRAARAWLAGGATLPLERHAHLPTTPGAVRNATRNLWICRAGELLAPGANTFTKAQCLERELSAFIERGQWRFWRDITTPPKDASELRAALFYAAKHNDGQCLSARQISRVIANK